MQDTEYLIDRGVLGPGYVVWVEAGRSTKLGVADVLSHDCDGERTSGGSWQDTDNSCHTLPGLPSE